jgi:head-tail adaptor
VWTILQVDHDTRSSRYRCWCRSAQIVAALTDRIHIQQAAWSKDSHGALAATWSNWKANLAARVQPTSAEADVNHDQRVLPVTHRVYLAEPVDLTVKHRVLHPSTGDVLHIRGYESTSQLDALFVLHCLKSPWQLA